MSLGFIYPSINFSTIDYSKIPNGAYFIGFNLDNGGVLSKLNNAGIISVIEGGGGGGSQGPQGPQGPAGSQGINGTQGPQGPAGSQGINGTQGPQGAAGESTSFFKYRTKTDSYSGNPGSGNIIWNNSSQTSATQININHLTDDGIDVDIFLALLSIGDKLIIQDRANSNNYQQWEIGSAITVIPNSYIEIPVTYIGGGYSFGNNDQIIFAIQLKGPQGPQGAQGAPGSTGSQGSQGPQGPQGVQGASAVNYEHRADNQPTFMYVGSAPLGTAEGSSTWVIRKVTFPVITTTNATGSWTNRASLIYT
jgi:hypothetical protein